MSQSAAQLASSLTPEQLAEAQWDIENAGRISLDSFKIALGCLFGLAILCFLGRICIRLYSRRRLVLDDMILTFGFVCLTGATAVLYKRIEIIYLEFSVIRGDPLAAVMAMQQINELYKQNAWMLSYLAILWTAIFAVKWCYFAFFYPFLRSMTKGLIRYYWSAVTFSIFSWLFLVIGEQLITCPHMGKEAGTKCFPKLPASKGALLALFWVCPVLDALTDATILVIPVVILRQSQMRLLTKIGIGIFLCLSIFMLSCSVIRAAGTYYHETLDFPWQVFWVHAEACIGVSMASITVYRSMLVGSNEVSDKLQLYLHKLFDKLAPSYTPGAAGESKKNRATPDHLLLKIPRATMTGIRTFFSRGSQTRSTPTGPSTQDSEFGLMEADYHTHLKDQAVTHAEAASKVDAIRA